MRRGKKVFELIKAVKLITDTKIPAQVGIEFPQGGAYRAYPVGLIRSSDPSSSRLIFSR